MTETPTPTHAQLGRRRLRAAAITLYGSLAIVGLAIPGAIVGALREAPPNTVTTIILAGAEPVADAIERLGVPAIYRAAKERFRAISCGAQDSENPC